MQDAGRPKPLTVALTLDVDPDANRAAPGRSDAVGPDGQVSVGACGRGLALVREMTSRRGLPVTLFWEGRTLREIARVDPQLVAGLAGDDLVEHGVHGFRHEDYAGTVSGWPMPRGEVEASLDAAEAAFADVFGRRPAGFRAPYCRMTAELAEALAARRYGYDASLTVNAPDESRLQPFRMPAAPRLWELPLCRGRDSRGRAISGYLWQLLEGRRQVADYADMAATLRGPCAGGVLQIALHPWHVLVDEDGRRLEATGAHAPAARLEALLERLLSLGGVEFATLSGYLGARSAHAGGAEPASGSPL